MLLEELYRLLTLDRVLIGHYEHLREDSSADGRGLG
jgi:hypothetical protein